MTAYEGREKQFAEREKLAVARENFLIEREKSHIRCIKYLQKTRKKTAVYSKKRVAKAATKAH